ncbi:MAG: UDP-N-acetylmuramate--alanine ligase [Elusimicrobia bacterium]|nr:UDP-N-acetylmuramate--alanine ligase [Elusimicrobiota bacterium]
MRLHFAGIFGSGMSAIAQYLRWNSLQISGSDRLFGNEAAGEIQRALEALGCRLYPQDGSGVTPENDGLVVSTAIEKTNPDIIKARALEIPVLHRSDVLAALANAKKTIAVTGTSGKSTVTALIFHLLRECQKNPSLLSGAGLNELTETGALGNAYSGGSDLLVIEADESDGSLAKYKPYVSVLLNLSKDHKPVPEILKLFETSAKQSANVFVNYDDSLLRAIKSAKTFGLDKKANFFPDKIELGRDSIVILKNGLKFNFPFPGRYNAYNLLAALCVCKFLGCEDKKLAQACADYKGIQRRFDRIQTSKGVTVIDDFAHNPQKITATLETVQNMSGRVIAIFQPHGFAPTKFMLKEYIETFTNLLRENDELYLLPIYYAGGTVSKDVSSADIAKGLKDAKGKIFNPHDRNDILPLIAASAKPGDIVISMGARDPTLAAFAQSIARAIDSHK